ncbi:MAG: DNA polymerase III subunit gamma/tau [Micavibrio aeruginosavorus]|uniref:DNA polymerase III subunit gamma/tau n=1 Tax=Micavibrio aeruginosavorus TaxID=349221 RepID=A0A2W5QA48_9BACT|nr:MAG: DNA polymerase III subunit gamma/tau [Micavibrio aeruginosavorus]
MSDAQKEYRVLARKYRPKNFDDLIGQEALVRTLKNAIESGRIAHAFMLTGIRGVGKTTTARIIAKALNYTGPDGKSGPTTGNTDDCDICKAITEDRHPDVFEMDAASRTGVDDIREILDGVRYAPTSARYKIYIIDEVHMLSKNAFNALLKTLEEPPPHVKFIFATTEIRKVPVTVLSRCQRFDLRRIDAETLAAYYKTITEKEGVKADDEALSLISRAADGSARDGLSMLDQAIALSQGDVTAQKVKDMLGLADRGLVLDLLENAVTGKCEAALSIMDDLYRKGADPSVIIGDMLDLSHLLTKIRAVPSMGETLQVMAKEEMLRASTLAAKLSMPSLGRVWQILLKGLNEVNYAPVPQKAAEMLIIRLAYAADLPDPADLIKKLKDGAPVSGGAPIGHAPGPSGGGGNYQTVNIAGGGGSAATALKVETASAPAPVTSISTLADVQAVLQQSGHISLASQVYLYVHLVKLEEGRLEYRPSPEASPSLAQELTQAMKAATGKRWMVSVSTQPGQMTLAQAKHAAEQARLDAVRAHPLVKQVFAMFPDAELKDIHTKEE